MNKTQIHDEIEQVAALLSGVAFGPVASAFARPNLLRTAPVAVISGAIWLFFAACLLSGGSRAHAQNNFTWDVVSDVSGGPVVFGDGQLIAFGSSSSQSASGTFSSHTGDAGSWKWTGSGPDFGVPASAAYGNGLFVAVGYGGIATSADGANWTTVSLSVTSPLLAVIYAHGLFVAVGGTTEDNPPNNPVIVTSSDGVNWTSRGPSFDGGLSSVAYGNGLFVAVGFRWFVGAGPGGLDVLGYAVLTSADGIKWTLGGGQLAPGIDIIAFGAGLFSEIAGNGIITSANGAFSPTAIRYIGSGDFAGAAYGDGWFVAVGSSIVVSSNGLSWTNSSYSLPSSASFSSVMFADGLFMAVSDNGIVRGRIGSGPPPKVPPSIVTAPQDQSVSAGGSAAFSVTASGSTPLSYQWQFDGANLPAQTNATLSIGYVLPANAGNYTVVVTNASGSVTSAPPAVLDVQYSASPTILTQPPATRGAQVGGSVEFGVLVVGDEPLMYQWQFNGADLPGQTSASLALSNVTAAESGLYAVTVSNGAGQAQSGGTLLTVSTLPQTVSTEYWPMYDGDARYYSGAAGPASFQCATNPDDGDFDMQMYLGETNGSPSLTLSMAYDTDWKTVFAESAKPQIGATLDFTPPWPWFEDAQLKTGGTINWSGMASVPNYTNIDSTGYVTVKNVGAVVVPAGTFQNCRQISTAGSGAVLGSLNQSMVLAPGVGPIQIGLYLPTPSGGTRFVGWESLTGGNVGGMDIRLLAGRDTTPPTVAVTSPKPGQVFSSATVTISGTASDNVAVSGVYYQLNSGGWNPALSGNQWASWTASVTPLPGTNLLRVYAVDTSGNYSATNSVVLIYGAPLDLSLAISAGGTVSLNGRTFAPGNYTSALTAGKSYPLTAKASAAYLFSGWTGGIVSSNASLTFVARTNLSLQANFAANPFTPLQGTFNGLFLDSSNLAEANSGFFTLTLAANGAFTGKIMTSGGTYNLPTATTFNTTGQAQFTVPTKQSALTFNLDLGVANAANQKITGTVSDGLWTAQLLADRMVFNATTDRAINYQGLYTLGIAGNQDSALRPGGFGCATLSISPAGLISMVGSLADGTVMSQSVSVSKDGRWPFYAAYPAPPAGNGGAVVGWLTFSNQPASALGGTLYWFRPKGKNPTFYQVGFTNLSVSVSGSAYNPNATPLLALSNGQVTLDGGNLPLAITNHITLSSSGSITVAPGNTNKLALTINKTTGALGGTFANPSNPKQTFKISGVLLQNKPSGVGYFLGTNESGAFQLED
jgi:hypothetical protein